MYVYIYVVSMRQLTNSGFLFCRLKYTCFRNKFEMETFGCIEILSVYNFTWKKLATHIFNSSLTIFSNEIHYFNIDMTNFGITKTRTFLKTLFIK